MKKLLLFLLTLMILPYSAKAFIDGPFSQSMSYDAIVTNPNGAKIYDIIDESTEDDDVDYVLKQVDTIPYNQKVAIIEEKYDLLVNDDNDFRIDMKESLEELKKFTFATININNKEKYIRIDDIKILENTYTIKNEDLIDNEEELYTLKDLVIKKGPADAFESTNTIIKKGEKIKTKNFLISSFAESCEDEAYKCNSYWKYVEYNNIKGYINSYESISYKDNNTYIFKSSIDLMYIEYKGEKIFIEPFEEKTYKDDASYKFISSHTIPANTIIKDNLLSYPTSRFYIVYIMNDGELISIPSYQLASKNDKIKITALKDLKVYNESSQTDKEERRKVITTIKKGESFVTNYYDTDDGDLVFLYYEKNDIKGWIEIEDDDFDGFAYLDKKSNTGKISNKASYCYIGKKNCDLPSNYEEQKGEVFTKITLNQTNNNSTNEQQQTTNNNQTTNDNNQTNNRQQIIKTKFPIKYISLIVGVILIIIIICIISKRKNKKEETNQENS